LFVVRNTSGGSDVLGVEARRGDVAGRCRWSSLLSALRTTELAYGHLDTGVHGSQLPLLVFFTSLCSRRGGRCHGPRTSPLAETAALNRGHKTNTATQITADSTHVITIKSAIRFQWAIEKCDL